MNLTVAICTRNRRERLLQLLFSLKSQKADVPWEVLVTDNGSEDGTSTAVESRMADFPVPLRMECEPRPGLSCARNRALGGARGTNVVFIDDDTTCLPGFVDAHARALHDHEVVATGGRIMPRLPPGTAAWLEETLQTTISGPTARYDFGDEPLEVGRGTGLPTPFGANMGMRRELAIEVGGFREDLGWGKRTVPGEETALLLLLASADERRRMVYVPSASVEHWIEPSKVTEEYFRRWYRGHGRSMVMIHPPESLIDRLGRISRHSKRALKWRIRSLAANGSRAEVLRKCSKAEGKLLQLLGC